MMSARTTAHNVDYVKWPGRFSCNDPPRGVVDVMRTRNVSEDADNVSAALRRELSALTRRTLSAP